MMRTILYTGIVMLGLLIFSSPIWQLAQLSRHNELYSHLHAHSNGQLVFSMG